MRRRLLAHSVETASTVRRQQDDELDLGLRRSVGGSMGLGETEVVELPDRRIAGGAHLAIRVRIEDADGLVRLSLRLREHQLSPRPEVASARAAAQRPLKRMAVRVDESGQRDGLGHAAKPILVGTVASRAVPAPLAQLPNALTVLRLALIPLFVAVYLSAGDGSSWAAGWIFLVAGVTDQVDGFLARRWHVESRFGKLADPLADRLMIDAAAILLALEGKLPWAGAAIIVLRDVLLVGGYRLLMPRGYDISVSVLGKLATWLLYLAVGILTVTGRATEWPLWLFWLALGLALAAAAQYVVAARREVAS